MILVADSEGPDQTADAHAQAVLDLRCPPIPEWRGLFEYGLFRYNHEHVCNNTFTEDAK